MSETPEGLTLEDAAFLDAIAAGFANVKVKPKGLSASRLSEAQAGTQEFRQRAEQLRQVAQKIRAMVSA